MYISFVKVDVDIFKNLGGGGEMQKSSQNFVVMLAPQPSTQNFFHAGFLFLRSIERGWDVGLMKRDVLFSVFSSNPTTKSNSTI